MVRRAAAAIATGAALAVALTACATGGAPEEAGTSPDDGRPRVLTTFTVLADIVGNVAGEHVVVESLTRVGAEIHGYEPTPQDVARASRADIVLDNGLGLEAWFAAFTADSGAPHVTLTDDVETIPIGAGSEYTGAANPHAWMSPSNVRHYLDATVAALSDLAPEHADDFAANADAYAAQVEQVRAELVTAIAEVPADQRVLVTCEGAFSYLAADVGLEEVYLWPVNAEQQSTPRQVAAVIDQVRERDVPAVFCESTVSAAGMEQVAAETGAAFAGTLYVDSLSEPDGPVPTYLDLLRHDARTIADGLTGATS
ncbi:metal ABC transporter solute-binding protein, Zn/Mn family [Litorihabitans aurantiacus]|uniref:Metal ABC transporter substrate-binding protein n=1 Tax=Litorihabitans aurantiacus TaxID=1930061 RepID=A0AA38CRK4_9MICO|nr:metal ABC transporter substrate-binding protein [Litorihabitans aurantiacus]